MNMPPLPYPLHKKELTKLSRLLILDTHLAYSCLLNQTLHLLVIVINCIFTLDHVVCTCAKYESMSEQYLPNSPLSQISCFPCSQMWDFKISFVICTFYLYCKLFVTRYCLTVLKSAQVTRGIRLLLAVIIFILIGIWNSADNFMACCRLILMNFCKAFVTFWVSFSPNNVY